MTTKIFDVELNDYGGEKAQLDAEQQKNEPKKVRKMAVKKAVVPVKAPDVKIRPDAVSAAGNSLGELAEALPAGAWTIASSEVSIDYGTIRLREENDLQAAQRRYREEQALLKAGKPTLKVTFGDLIRRREQR